MGKKKKPKKLRCGGTISTSNVNADNQCITLTYVVKNVGNLLQAKKLIVELDELHNVEQVANSILITNFESIAETIDIKYQLKACDGEAEAHIIKTKLDTFLKKRGGQTTLDEVSG